MGNSESSEMFVRLRGVEKAYRRGKHEIPVLQKLDFDVPRGSFEAIMGPSGSGKTTLLNIVSGIDRASAGSVLVGGIDISGRTENELADWRARTIGFVFQFYNLVQVLTAYQNVELPLLLAGLRGPERRQRVEMALELVGLKDRQQHYPNELSGGQEQRVGIARAIVADPELIVADEPTGDLDRESATAIMAMFDVLHRELGKTILMVTHDAEVAARAQIIRRIDKGKLVESQSVNASRKPEVSPAKGMTSSAVGSASHEASQTDRAVSEGT